jgi:hypothetical protein
MLNAKRGVELMRMLKFAKILCSIMVKPLSFCVLILFLLASSLCNTTLAQTADVAGTWEGNWASTPYSYAEIFLLL